MIVIQTYKSLSSRHIAVLPPRIFQDGQVLRATSNRVFTGGTFVLNGVRLFPRPERPGQAQGLAVVSAELDNR